MILKSQRLTKVSFIADHDAGPSRSAVAPDLVHSVHTGTQAHGVASPSVIADLVPEGKRTWQATYWFSVSAG